MDEEDTPIIVEHKVLSGCKTVALNRSGTLALIVGKANTGLINLDNPGKLIYNGSLFTSKTEISEIQFSLGDENLCAFAAGWQVKKLPLISLYHRYLNLIQFANFS